MENMLKRRNAVFEDKVAFEAVKGEKTLAQLASEYWIHGNQIRQWRKPLLEEPAKHLFRQEKEI